MPRTPLYRLTAPRTRATEGHRGLWFDKFCNVWQEGEWSLGEAKGDWVSQVAGNCGNTNTLKEYRERQQNLIGELNGCMLAFQTIAPVVSGLGRTNPVENGFVWHQTLGTPYFPGSSVKGAVRAYAKETMPDQVTRLFGADSESDETSQGTVIFFDAIPYAQCIVQHDVMTPHYSDWYMPKSERLEDNLPGDWISPTPIPFLSVAPKQKFLFGFICKNSDDTEMVAKLLQEALFEMGLGAKTSSGYGRFKPDDEYNKKLVQDREDKNKKLLEEAKKNSMAEWERDFEPYRTRSIQELAKFINDTLSAKSDEYKQQFANCILTVYKRTDLNRSLRKGEAKIKGCSESELKKAWDLISTFLPEA